MFYVIVTHYYRCFSYWTNKFIGLPYFTATKMAKPGAFFIVVTRVCLRFMVHFINVLIRYKFHINNRH